MILKLEEDKKKQDILAKILYKSYHEKSQENMINFKFLEKMMKKILKKAGYKAAIKKRERDEEAHVEYVIPEDTFAPNIMNDFRNFIKLFLQSHDLLDEISEFEILFLPYFSKLLTVKAFVVTPHEMCEILVINVLRRFLLLNS